MRSWTFGKPLLTCAQLAYRRRRKKHSPAVCPLAGLHDNGDKFRAHGRPRRGTPASTKPRIRLCACTAPGRVVGHTCRSIPSRRCRALQAGGAAAAVVLPFVTGGEEEAPGGSFMGPKEGSSGGPGAGKAFSPATQQEAVNENTAANGGPARCVYCGTKVTNESGPDKVNIDHAQARANGGNNTLKNAQVTCQFCNQSKGAGPAPKNPKPTAPPPKKPKVSPTSP